MMGTVPEGIIKETSYLRAAHVIWGDSLDGVSSSVCKQSRNTWSRAWSEQWLSARRKADSAMFEFVCRPGWRLYKNLFILVGETALAVTGAWNQGYTHYPLSYSLFMDLSWMAPGRTTQPPFRLKFSSMSESSQTSQADLCDVKSSLFLEKTTQEHLFKSHRSAHEDWVDSDILENFSRNGGYVVLARSHSMISSSHRKIRLKLIKPDPNINPCYLVPDKIIFIYQLIHIHIKVKQNRKQVKHHEKKHKTKPNQTKNCCWLKETQ